MMFRFRIKGEYCKLLNIFHTLKLSLWKPWACEMHSAVGMYGCINQFAPQLAHVLDSEPFMA